MLHRRRQTSSPMSELGFVSDIFPFSTYFFINFRPLTNIMDRQSSENIDKIKIKRQLKRNKPEMFGKE